MQISVWKRLHVYYMCCRFAGAQERFKNPIVGEERDHLICSQSPLWTAQRDLMCLHICWCGVYMLVGKRGGLLLNAIHSLTCLFVIVSLSLFLNSAAVDLISLQCHLGSLDLDNTLPIKIRAAASCKSCVYKQIWTWKQNADCCWGKNPRTWPSMVVTSVFEAKTKFGPCWNILIDLDV